MFPDGLGFIDDCLALAARQVEILGEMTPCSVEDVAMPDLSCDAFEFLYEARQATAANRPTVVFPMMRLALESIGLCHLFTVRPDYARKWSKGQKISNSEVRKHLEHAPMLTSADQLRIEYNHFSQGAHPNRTHLSYRFLGEGKQFTVGAICSVDPLIVGDHIHHLIDIEFFKLTPRVECLRATLYPQLVKEREEWLGRTKPEGIGPAFFDKGGEP